MRRALEALLAVIIAALVLPSPRVDYLPAAPGPSADELKSSDHDFAKRTWDALRVSESMDAPEVEQLEPLARQEWNAALIECAFELPNVDGMSSSSDGVSFFPKGRGFDPATEIALYQCAVAHPILAEGQLLSLAQLTYLHNYYTRWVVPCLREHGYGVDAIPDRSTFIALHGDWSPYWTLVTPEGKDVQSAPLMDEAITTCGQDRPGI